MIVSHRHRFIFIHTRKTAGSSIKCAFAPFLGDHDVVIGSWNEILDSGVPLNYAGEQALRSLRGRTYYWAARAAGKRANEAVNIGIKGYYQGVLSRRPPHPTAAEARRFFSGDWDDYFKFAFVRNPWEQAASDYLWRVRATGREISFREYLEGLENRRGGSALRLKGAGSNWDMVAEDDHVVMDFVGRYESLDHEFRQVCTRIGVDVESLGVRAKANVSGFDYATLYGPKEKEIVERLAAREIETFGYRCPY